VSALGVENEAQRDLLAELGCHWQQGFLFARPAPASEAPPWATPSDPRAVDQRRAWPPVSQPSSRARPH
jgi:EAL domain-containing protein (putative c-di-GMP-specific phosphodiesterase class I)